MTTAHIRSVVLVLLACAFLLLFGIVAHQYVNLATTISVYLLVTLAIADSAGFVEASIVSVVATLCLEHYFAAPLISVQVDRFENLAALLTIEGFALIVSRNSERAHRQQLLLERQNIEQRALFELCRDVLLLDWRQSAGPQLCVLIKRSFPLKGLALWNGYEDSLACVGDTRDVANVTRAVYFGQCNYDDGVHGNAFRVLYLGTRAVGSLSLCGHSLDPLTINSITSITAMAIERTRSRAMEIDFEAERQSEQLRSALLDGLAHAFKTPLSTITLSSSGLLVSGELSGKQAGLIDLINQEATRLGRMTSSLLRTSRLELAKVCLHEEVIEVHPLLQRVVDECAVQLQCRTVEVSVAPEVNSVLCDSELLTLALVQIVDNAAKYGSPGSQVRISASGCGSLAVVRIHNEGSYIPPAERSVVFRRFYRSPSVKHRAPGTGLGLSVAKNLIEAHDGSISIESDVQSGTTFAVAIPARMRKES